jgi:hypothetical protein
MRVLRSRWTIVALVPAFFLAGFGIVAALGGGSDDPDPGAAELGSAGTEDQGAVTVIGPADSQATTTDPGATTAPGDTTGGGATTTTTGNGGGGGGGGKGPPAPPPGEIAVDYGQWDGMFALENTSILPDFGYASLLGELSYNGGVDCPVGLVRVKAWFYSERGTRVGTGEWESVQSTGDGGEVTGREPLPFELVTRTDEGPASAALRFTAVECL